MANNKKTYLTIFLAIVALAFVVVGILKGWFRSDSKLSQDDVTRLSSVKKAEVPTSSIDASRGDFKRLWQDHVALTREVILAEFNNSPDLNSKADLLMKNQEDIGNEVNKFYPGSGLVVTDLLKEHIAIAKDILDDLKFKRLTRVASDISKWYGNADRFSLAMKAINPNWNLKDHMRTHLDITENEALAEFVGLKSLSRSIYKDKIVPQAEDIARHLVEGIRKDNSFV